VLLLSSILCTFVYINYFENELADGIVTGFERGNARDGWEEPSG
jgi:hypothetical protein